MIFIQNKKFIVRLIEKHDINKSFINSLNDKKLNKFTTVGEKKQSLSSAFKYFHFMSKKKYLYLCVIDKLQDKFVGTITYRIRDKKYWLGYMIFNRKYLGNNIFVEAARMSLKHFFRKNRINKIFAGTNKENLASIFFLTKIGFKLIGKTKKALDFKIKKINLSK
jgi:RimJ/RimL family protein N-acetyltransferase